MTTPTKVNHWHLKIGCLAWADPPICDGEIRIVRALVLVLLLVFPPLVWGDTDSAVRPNIVLLLVDDLGWTDTSTGLTCRGQGSDYFETPHVDRLAKSGICFTSAYSNGPNCAPSRASLFSGQFAARTGVYTVGNPNRGRVADRKLSGAPNKTKLEDTCVTLAEALRDAGYRCGHAGKWHLGDNPCTQGFHVNFGGTKGGSPRGQFADKRGGWKYPNMPANGVAKEWLDDRLTTEAIAFMRSATKTPFFMSMCFYGVHTPVNAPHADFDHFANKPPGERHRHQKYAAYVKSVDDNVGRILEFLETTDDPRSAGQKLIANSLIVFSSDNGGVGGWRSIGVSHSEFTTQVPLTAGKGSLYEGGIRVPFVLRWDAAARCGETDDTPIQLLDLYPTFCEVANAQTPSLDGVSLVGLATQGTPISRKSLYWHFPAYLQGRQGPRWSSHLANHARFSHSARSLEADLLLRNRVLATLRFGCGHQRAKQSCRRDARGDVGAGFELSKVAEGHRRGDAAAQGHEGSSADAGRTCSLSTPDRPPV